METAQMTSILERLIKSHDDLLALGERKTDVLKLGDMKALDVLLKEEDLQVKKLQVIEKERMLKFANVTLRDILAQSEAREKEKLLNLQGKLVQTYDALKNRNELNQELLEHSLQYVNMSLSMVQPQSEPATYSNPKTNPYTSQSSSLFDSKA
ncbi:flagellar protein FlgN [Fictibacillus phosphorivorans]|uniref:flagellar protein FlgN n=1 Tax=Fictibacillus phosphorivorans TaxID=1221500 RepID=UPI00203CA9E6|nr:flagellar protein FlgN [Fictibacillus phosphorivorans]MCM3718468.1 flagellar protein FlgN [Fictibacillus phosphorivorans]MCM3776176.1 flagellar protein FlgN [Fictibacillus phosphorivorans]